MVVERMVVGSEGALTRFWSSLAAIGGWLSGASSSGEEVAVRGRILNALKSCPVYIGSGCIPGKAVPVANIAVTAHDRLGRRVAVTQTDDEGHYEFDLAPGTYIIMVSDLGIGRRAIVRDFRNSNFDLIQL